MLDGRDELLTEFDESLWLGIVNQMKVIPGGGFTFALKDRGEMFWRLKEKNIVINPQLH